MENTAKEGQITGAEYREERTVVHQGATLFAEERLCLGDSFDPQHCLRIHFAPFEDKVVVAWCGRHLRNTKGA